DQPGGAAHEMLSHWLENRPSERFFENSLRAIRVVLDLLPEEQRRASRRDLIAYCNQIASAVSSGIFGPGRILDEERALISHIAAEIGQGRQEAGRRGIERGTGNGELGGGDGGERVLPNPHSPFPIP